MSRTFKHLAFEDRLEIERMLSVDATATEIAAALGFSHQSITREIIRSRVDEGRARIYGKHWNGCVFQRTCQVRGACGFDPRCTKRCASCRMVSCTRSCPEFKADACPRLARSPYCRNGCPSYKACAYPRLRYSAKTAQIRADELLTSSRTGPDLTEDELSLISRISTPLLKKGQSPAQIWLSHSDRMPCSERSFYRYLEDGYIEGAIKLDLPCAVAYKPRRSDDAPSKSNIPAEALIGRTYADFLLLGESERAQACEMDCVCGRVHDEAALLTVYFRPWRFQFVDLLGKKNTLAVSSHVDAFAEFLEPDFPPCTLLDRGSEFSCPEGIEASGITGEKRTSVYYCDPRHPEQRGGEREQPSPY